MPTLNVSLTDELAEYIEREVSGGDYVSASEVVRDALRAMRHDREKEEAKLRLLRAEIDKGLAAAERGEYSTRSMDDIVEAVLAGEGN
jgi:antitoxin ParD1/3/4